MKHARKSTSQRFRPRLAVTGSGLAAGLISSLAISALLLLVERVSELPVGTFYLVLAFALLQTEEHTIGMVALGFLMHLAAGSVIGLAISVPFSASRRLFAAGGKYAPAYGLAAGFVLWSALFLPITYGIMLPLLNAADSQAVMIRQKVPTGEAYTVAMGELLAMMDRVVVGALAFNMFYGLLAVTLSRSLYEAYLRRNRIVL
ncbi:hypothetical protein Ngar_c33250 [Candidatus Nitrososphaera gargensis Ga9.2]|uniref:Uncharacterized protein n=1 Tax=Nitrososphaera gargensis (strain Ga9.2) TaxID=1237085 RepID=K0IJM1_NITGG|nr:hypothetical protein [Candidatus Nitrososphaera gargensis]AFU60240.1 hypothetical protein Ngar_c33250 [Candidatus Nitrososphaera gargensis Ga9.2]